MSVECLATKGTSVSHPLPSLRDHLEEDRVHSKSSQQLWLPTQHQFSQHSCMEWEGRNCGWLIALGQGESVLFNVLAHDRLATLSSG